jgi:hypothetical protein
MNIFLLYTTLALFTPALPAQSNHAAFHVKDCYTFTVDNVTTDSLGDVTVNGLATGTYIDVTGNGFFEQNVCFPAVSVTIQGNVVLYPNSADFQLADGTMVKVGWQSPSLVEVKNEHEQGGPNR